VTASSASTQPVPAGRRTAASPLLDPATVLGGCLADADAHAPGDVTIRWADGTSAALHVARWVGEVTSEEHAVLDRLTGPVLDVGCRPGRHVAELQRRCVMALGIDVLPEAIAHAQARGAVALSRSVFDHVPLTGTWRTALLLDGNVGIGGDPAELLRRVAEVLVPGGTAVVELEDAGVGLRSELARLETPAGTTVAFRWGRVGVDGLSALTAATGFTAGDPFLVGGRWFAELTSPDDARVRPARTAT
jgi:SAM-dependent methyltransferase